MGLASKLAAAQAGAAPGGAGAGGYGAPPGAGAPPQQYGQAQQSYGGAPNVPGSRPGQGPGQQPGQYAPPPGAPPSFPQAQAYGQQQPGQYGQQQPGQYGQQQPGQQQPGQYGQQPGQYGQQGQPQQGQTQYGQPQYGQPQQHQYGQPQQQQYGQQLQYPPPPGAPGAQGAGGYAPPPGATGAQGAGGYAPPPGAPGAHGASGGQTSNPGFLLQTLQQCVQDQKIQAFYPPGSLDMIAAKIASTGALDKIAAEWKLPMELAGDLVKIALFDVILYIDDSGSMAFEEGGERIDDLKLIMSRVAYATSLFDQDGIQVRFMNNKVEGNNISSESQALQLIQQIKFSGLTPLGTSLWQKILQPLVIGPARANALQKPVLIIAITDGSPAGENKDEIINVILRTNQELQRSRYGPDAVSYQFAQVGNDLKATKFLETLDNHPQVGDLIDCTSSFEIEQEEMARKSGVQLDPMMWLVKLLMGPIDSSYDTKDE